MLILFTFLSFSQNIPDTLLHNNFAGSLTQKNKYIDTETHENKTHKFDSLVLQGMQYSYEENYTKALETFFLLSSIEPQNPFPYLLIASLYGLYMNDFSTDTVKEQLLAYCDTTILLANRQIKEGSRSALTHLCLAGAYGIRVFCNFAREKVISGIYDAFKSTNEFSKTLELDSTMVDAYIGIAAYNYFKYRLLSFIPLSRDSKWEDELKIACNNGKFKVPATTGYTGILIEEKRFNDAITIITPVITKFPASRTFRWLRVKAMVGAGKFENAKKEYEKLLHLTITGQPGNLYNEGHCRLGLANVLYELGKYDECAKQCEKILAFTDAQNLKELKKQAQKLKEKLR